MRQVIQNLGDGQTSLADCPAPRGGSGAVTIRSLRSVISGGTERMLLGFGKANWIEKARQQPDKVRLVIEKVRTDGIAATLESVRSKLEQPIPLGYSNAGIVIDVGSGVAGFRAGDRVVSNGPHAEIVTVPQNLCATIPDGVTDDEAAFTVIASIALQGVRLAEPTLGECFAVTGLGLIGLIVVQLLRAHGCRVLGIDFVSEKLALAAAMGAEVVNLSQGEDPVSAAARFSRGRGLDGVLIAAASRSSEPVHQAALMCRKRGRIVLVGVAGLELSRDDFYKKELSFQVSCSYGPGRYDPKYESGQDYPNAFVRWTAQRNFEAVLDMMADGRLQLEPLISHRFSLAEALDAYKLLETKEPYLGVLLKYDAEKPLETVASRSIEVNASAPGQLHASPRVGFIGAGSYAGKVLLPAFRKAGADFVSIASAGGLSAAYSARKHGFREATSDATLILSNPDIDAVVIATRHNSHASMVCNALKAGKHVFVEKPLSLTFEDLDEIARVRDSLSEGRLLMVGFNRRFAPHIVRMKKLLESIKEPKAIVYTVNAGAIPLDHWTQDTEIGGGRIVGEVCHFLDLLRFLVGHPARQVKATRHSVDTMTISLSYEDGSIGTVHYFSNGDRVLSKERVEVFAGGHVLQLDNFRRLRGYGWPSFKQMNSWRQDKGANAMVDAFVKAIWKGKPSPIPFDELLEVSRSTLEAASV